MLVGGREDSNRDGGVIVQFRIVQTADCIRFAAARE